MRSEGATRGRKKWGLAQVLWRLVAPYVRLGAFLLVVVAAFSAWRFQRARAQLDRAMIQMGEQLMPYVRARRIDEPRGLIVNGERLFFASGTTDDPVDAVLDYYEAKCRQRDGRLVEQFYDVGKVDRSKIDWDHPGIGWIDGTLREGTDRVGYVACFDTGSGETVGPRQWLQKLQAFAESGDLADIGELRYVFVRKGRDHTHLMAFWTQGSFNLKRMFPERGDAPGNDVAGVPRPPGARRILSSFEEGTRFEIAVYTGSHLDGAALEGWYREALQEKGWQMVDPAAPVAARYTSMQPSLVAERDGQAIALVLSDEQEGGTATVLAEHL